MLMTTDNADKQKVSNTKGKAIGLYIDIYMYIDIYCVYRVNKLNAIFIKALTIKIQSVYRQIQT